MDSDIYNLYKPLRNHLRAISIENGLYVIWAYLNFLQFDGQFPGNIEVSKDFIINKNNISRRGIYEWELSLLAREVVVNAQRDPSLATKFFNKYNYFSSAINKLKNFENEAWPIFGNNKNVLKEISRVGRRQFPWQTKPSSVLFFRYYKIFNNSRISSIVEEHIGLSVKSWYILGIAVLGASLKNCKLNIDPEIKVAGLTIEDFNKFFSYISTTVENLKEIIKRDIDYNDEFVYSFNPLEYYPLLKIGSYYYCPINTFIAWRTTSGIYYDIDQKDGNFGKNFGLAFQDYLLEISHKIVDKSKYQVLPEAEYYSGKDKKDSIDIIIANKESAYFVEAKTKRLSVKSRSQFLSDDSINKDIKIIAEAIVQMYSTINDYKMNLYNHFRYDPNIQIFPTIVTLEEWFLLGYELETLDKEVRNIMKQKSLPENYLTEMPYAILSSLSFECLIQKINQFSIDKLMTEWFQPDKKGHDFGNFLMSKGEAKYINNFFPEIFEAIIPGITHKNKTEVDNSTTQ